MANDVLKFPSDVDGMHGVYLKIHGVDITAPRIVNEFVSEAAKFVLGGAGGIGAAVINKFTSGAEKFAAGSQIPSYLPTDQNIEQGEGGVRHDLGTLSKIDKGIIFLPMPLDVSVNYNAGWSGRDLNFVEYFIRHQDYYKQFPNQEGKNLPTRALNFLAAGATVSASESLISAFTGGENVSRAMGIMQAAGKVLNPYRELMYDGPSLRMFKFDWTLSPKNEKESKTIYDIIYLLKKSLHPITSGKSIEESIVWEYPDYVDVVFVTKVDSSITEVNEQVTNPYLFEIKKCAISNLSVRYDNKFHNDGSPSAVSIELTLMETEVLTQESFSTGGVMFGGELYSIPDDGRNLNP